MRQTDATQDKPEEDENRLVDDVHRIGIGRHGFGQRALVIQSLVANSYVIPGFWPEAVGSWWDATHQIDLVAVSYQQRTAWLGEARWRGEPMGLQDLEILQRRARAWQGAETGWHLYYTLFSRGGFTQTLQARAGDDSDLLLFGPEDVVG